MLSTAAIRMIGPAAACILAATVVGVAQANPQSASWLTVANAAAEPAWVNGKHGYIANAQAQTVAFREALRPEDRKRLARIDYHRFVVVAVLQGFPTSGYSLEIRSVRLSGRTVLLSVATKSPVPGTGVLETTTTGYHVIAIRRSTIATPRPTRVKVVASSTG